MQFESFHWLSHHEIEPLLYLPTRIRFLTGENVSHALGQNSLTSLEQTKLTNSLGKQQEEPSTST